MSEAIGDEDTSGLASVSGGAVADADAKAEVVDKNEADRIRTRVIQLRNQMSDGYFEMGRLLHRISANGLYTQWRKPDGTRYDSFREYVEHEVEFKFRKAKHLMSIWWWFAEELDDPSLPEKIKQIGWTKAAALVGVVDTKNAEAWIRMAKGLGLKELEDEARKALEKAGRQRPSRPSSGRRRRGSSGVASVEDEASSAGDDRSGDVAGVGVGGSEEGDTSEVSAEPDVAGGNDVEVEADETSVGVDPLSEDESRTYRSRWTVLLDKPQRQNVEQACDVASEIAEVVADGKGYCLDFVATAFLALHGGSGGNAQERKVNMRNDILMAVQRTLGIDVVAFEAGTSHAIFGEQTIDRIASEAEGAG